MLDNITDPLRYDNILVEQELIHSIFRNESKRGLIAYKIDMEKAYDRVSWGFLKALIDFGFDHHIINPIMHYVTTSSFTILWNGSKLPNFHSSSSLR